MYRGLLCILVMLGLVLITGAIYGVFFHGIPPGHKQIAVLHKGQSEQGQTFTGIGRIRVSTTSSQPEMAGMVILFVTFTYYPDDKAFSEELALRVGEFREIIVDYIGSIPVPELQKKGEESIKIELLRRFNTILRLGQIERLNFSDFMIVE